MNVYFLWLSSHGLSWGSPAQWNGSLESVWLARSRVDWLADCKKKHRLQRFIIFRSRDWHRDGPCSAYSAFAESQMGDLDAKLERGLLYMCGLSKVHELERREKMMV